MWYSADLLFQSVHEPGSESADANGVWEESVVLIEASSEQEANALAHRMGREREVSYKNVYDETVTWRFDSLVQLCEIGVEPPSHGSEVFSRFLKKDEVTSIKSGFPDSEGQARG
jgi:hypothetical protein